MITVRRCLPFLLLVAALALLAACTTKPTPSAQPPAPSVAQTGELLRMRGEHFSAAGECAFCHTALSDSTGKDVSIDSAWRPSMMANSARDPYYLASVRSEVLAQPDYRDVIEEKCAVCHIGMAFHTARLQDKSTALLADGGYLNPQHPDYPLALDGVSCSLCHQIQGNNFGMLDSYSGGYLLDAKPIDGERPAFGRFAVDENMATVMRNASGYQPMQSEHVTRSEFCAVCHNLFTPYFTNQGVLSEELFPEQTPHLEWLASRYPAEASCQTCHMPQAQGETPVANTGSPRRSPFQQHTFIGGNQFMLQVLSANSEEMRVSAIPEQFEQASQLTLDQLHSKTARLSVSTQQEGQTLNIDVSVEVLTGHKFPTSFPSRRAWLHVSVHDAADALVFESGGWQPDGSIIGNANDEDESRYEPHYTLINDPLQVQIYEPIIADPDGKVTTTLLRAQSYLKDNRLLPYGFDKAAAPIEIAVLGEALQDEDFLAGGDRIRYQVQLGNGTAPYNVEVELLYQTIGYRWVEKFRQQDNPEGRDFYRYTAAISNAPVQITRQTIQVSPKP